MVNRWKDPWFYYKFLSAAAILFSVLGVYLYHMISQTWTRDIDYPFSYLLFQGNFLSYFTYQSNIIVGIWFLLLAIYHNKKNKVIDNQNIALAITCYISVTCFIFLIILVPAVLETKEKFSFPVLLGAIFFHVIAPALMITYTLIHVKPMPITPKEYYKKSFWLYLIYPWAYTIFLILRLVIYSNVPSLKDMPLELVYPYLPMLPTEDISNVITNGELVLFLMIGFFIVVHLSFILFNLLYFYSMKKLGQEQKKRHKIKQKSKLKANKA